MAIDREWKVALLEVCHLVFVKHPIYTFIRRRNRVGNKSHSILPKWTATCATISGRLVSSAALEEELEVSRRRLREREKERIPRRKSREEVRCCHSTSGKCIYRISSNGRTRLSGLCSSFASYHPSCLSSLTMANWIYCSRRRYRGCV